MHQVYVRDCTPVSPFALMLFGGALKAAGNAARAAAASRGGGRRGGGASAAAADEECRLTVDGWIKFKVTPGEQSLMLAVREQLDALLREKIARPSLELTRHGQGVLQAVTALLAIRPPER